MSLKLNSVVDSNFHGSERLLLLLNDDLGRCLSQARLLRWDVAPFLDDGLLDLPGVGSGPGADLLGHIHTLLGGGELGDQLGDVLASPLGLQRTLLLGGVLDNSLDLVVALLLSLSEATASWSTELPGLLGTSGDGSVLLHVLLGDAADLPGPLGALGVGGVAGGFVLALLVHDSLAADHVVLHVMDLLLGPALGLVLSPADLRALDIAVLHQRGSADLDSLVEGDLLVLDETALSEVLLALLLLLGLVVGDVGGVAPLVVGVITLNHIVVLGLLHHLDLVNTSLSISSRGGSSHGSKAHIWTFSSLSLVTAGHFSVSMVITMVIMMVGVIAIGVEGEGVDEGLAVPVDLDLTSQFPGPEHALAADDENKKQLSIHIGA